MNQPVQQSKKLRVGLIVDSHEVSKYVYDIAAWGKAHDTVDVTHVFVQRTGSSGSLISKMISSFKKNGILFLLSQVGYVFIIKFESFLLKKIKKHHDHFSKMDLRFLNLPEFEITPVISNSGYVFRYDDNELEKIKSAKLDVLIRFGSGILRGKILSVVKFGVLSFHHGDNKLNRGGPPGFWEVYYREDKTGFIIQKLTDELDGGRVLFRGYFQTKIFHVWNQANLYAKSNFYLKKLLSEMSINGDIYDEDIFSIYSFPLYRRPNLSQQFIYMAKFFWLIFLKFNSRFFLRKFPRWGVSFLRGDWKNAVLWRGIKIPNPKRHFLADPFVISHKEKDYCFVENYDYDKKIGCISVYKLHLDHAEEMGEVIKESFHMSFPFVFEHNSNYYMVPETAESNSIRLYECISFPMEWKLKVILLENVQAVDTIVFNHNDKWWLLTGIDPSNTMEFGSELFLFYSNDILSENWTPHCLNPIFVDPDFGRNAGILFDEIGGIYRVSQKSGYDSYGKSTAVHRIIDISENSYQEEMVINIEPKFFQNLEGTHHFHSNKTAIVYDYVKKESIN